MRETIPASAMETEILPERDRTGYVLLDRRTDPDDFRSAIVEYFRHPYASYQAQSKVEALTAADDYLQLIGDLSQHEGQLACLIRIGNHGALAGDQWGNSSCFCPIEDLTVFLVQNPTLAVAKIPETVALENRHGRGHIEGIVLLQPLIGYARRSNDYGARSWAVFSESQGHPVAKDFNRYDPYFRDDLGKIYLSWIDLYSWVSHPLARARGLEYAAREMRMPSIAYSPTRFERHMRLIVGDDAVAQTLRQEPVEACPDTKLHHLLKLGYLSPGSPDNSHAANP